MHPSSSLGARLNTIFDMVKQAQQSKAYSCVWDCCCDHGYLGTKILYEKVVEKLYFVDQLPHIITRLRDKLAPFDTGNYQMITANAADLVFNVREQHMVILAGIGGETSVEIVSAIENNHPDTQIDYLFCPSAGHKELREYLISQRLGIISESLVCENKRYYEILFIKGKSSTSQLPRVTERCELWSDDNEDHQRYLKKINTPRQSKKSKRKKPVKIIRNI